MKEAPDYFPQSSLGHLPYISSGYLIYNLSQVETTSTIVHAGDLPEHVLQPSATICATAGKAADKTRKAKSGILRSTAAGTMYQFAQHRGDK